MIWVEDTDFSMLYLILANARWAGAPSQEQVKEEYLRLQMWEAVRRLPSSEELLVEVLIEIIAEMEEG
jgi:hypothetical protein